MWKTRITEMFGIKYPVILGAYGEFGTSAIAVPVSEAGGLGTITASALRTPEKLREDIRKARELTDKPIALTISVQMNPDVEGMLKVALEEKVPVIETGGFRADELGKRIKDAGIKWVHKVASVKHAVAAERQGVDAVHILTLEGIGFKSVEQLPTLTTTTIAAKKLSIPLIVSGGIGDARGLLGALAMGADGVAIGTALMATTECPVTERVKKHLLKLDEDDEKLRKRCLSTPTPEEYARVMKRRGKIANNQWLRELSQVMLGESSDRVEEKPTFELEEENVFRAGIYSLAAAVVDKIVTVDEFITKMMNEAEEIVKSNGIGWVPD
ncbi:NAD(P)H-dependent flavin oxidoreductase [Thermodesulfobacteriota bacterium]